VKTNVLEVELKIKVKLSLWDAIKLRIAGDAAKDVIKQVQDVIK
jgi:hypothetical protein